MASHRTEPRNRIVLADDVMLAQQLSELASGGSRVRHININYLVSPITNLGSAHAEAHPSPWFDRGHPSRRQRQPWHRRVRLSRGEAFCRYDVSASDKTQLSAFQVAKEFLDTMVAFRGYLDSRSAHHLDAMWSDVPWIWAPAPTGPPPVRHNLNVPLAEQLLAFVGDEPVTDVVFHAPFFDRTCEALRLMLSALKPGHATVLVQERRTSVDPSSLRVCSRNATARPMSTSLPPPTCRPPTFTPSSS